MTKVRLGHSCTGYGPGNCHSYYAVTSGCWSSAVDSCLCYWENHQGGLANSTMIERGSMSQDDLEKLPCFDFKEREKGTSPVDCTVCLENFKVGERCRLLPLCKHSFHAECVDSWLLRTPVCPICRTCADFLKDGSVSGEESSQFIGSLIELREIQTPELGNISDETTIELEDSQITKSSHLSDTSSIEVRERGQSSGIDGHETDS